MTDKRAICFIFLFLIIITFLGIIIFLHYPENTLGKEEEKIIAKKIDFKDCIENETQTYCEDKIYIGTKEINVLYNKMDISDSESGAELHVNGVKILKESDLVFRITNKLYVTEKTIVFGTYESGVLNIKIYIYDLEGNKIKEIYKLDSMKNIIVEDFEFINNKIIFDGKKHILYKSVVLHQENDNKYIFQNADLCQEYLENQNLNGDDIYTGKWQIEYLTKTRFSTIKIVEGTYKTIKDHLKNIGCEF